MDYVAILDNIRSLHNVGSMFRTADGAGIEKLYLTGITPAPIDRFGKPRAQVSKTSLGAEGLIAWEKQSRTWRVIEALKKEGFNVFAIEQAKSSTPYTRAKRAKHDKIALVVGNEISGLSKAVLKRVDKILEIPMRGKKESLNVSVAFGVAAFHFSKKK